jgi:hypothetical protein
MRVVYLRLKSLSFTSILTTKPYLIVVLFFLTLFFGCTPSTDTVLLHEDIPTPEELALAVSQSDIYKDFSSAATPLRENEVSFSIEDLQA